MHEMLKKIYYHDTDCGGVVYYANYLKYFEEARTEFLTDTGIDLKLLSQNNTWFVVKGVEIDYKVPARYADQLMISSQITKIKNVSLEFIQEIKRDTELLVCAKTKLVCVDSDFRPKAIPDNIRSLLQK